MADLTIGERETLRQAAYAGFFKDFIYVATRDNVIALIDQITRLESENAELRKKSRLDEAHYILVGTKLAEAVAILRDEDMSDAFSWQKRQRRERFLASFEEEKD